MLRDVPPTVDLPIVVEHTGHVGAGAHLEESPGRRVGLSGAVVAPAEDLAVVPQRAGVVQTGGDRHDVGEPQGGQGCAAGLAPGAPPTTELPVAVVPPAQGVPALGHRAGVRLPRRQPAIEVFAEHLTQDAKILEEDPDTVGGGERKDRVG